MTTQFVFLDVGNADSMIVQSGDASAIIIDIPKPSVVRKWLERQGVVNIDCIYFTHGHADHLPSLYRVVTFIKEWLKHGVVKTVCIPTETIRKAWKRLQASASEKASRKNQQLGHALARLRQWEREKTVVVKRVERDPYPHKYGPLDVYVLHPSYLFYEAHHTKYSRKLNETSLVLRIEYGDFSALMLADVEGSGVKELLSYSQDEELRANLVKIPHHGAWSKHSSDTGTLLEKIDAEVAVLSVGSKNPYGHVVPELFRTLLTLQAAPSHRLKSFLCTEVTRTCIFSASERAGMGRAGLANRQPCAGDIVITVDEAGQWVFGGKGTHQQRIAQLSRPACLGRADL